MRGGEVAELGEHAVVLGASMSGLLAATVLTDFYRNVTVVERDVLSDRPDNRRGVPQGWHGHVLGARGSLVLEKLFPGILDDLVADGVPAWNDGDVSKVSISIGGRSTMPPSGRLPHPHSQYFPSRPRLEWHVRRRVRQISTVTIIEGHEVAALTSAPDRGRVTGVRVTRADGGDAKTLTADLVVDATGRGSRAPIFLSDLGYEKPRVDELTVRLAYASQMLRLPQEGAPHFVTGVFPVPGRSKVWALIAQENNTAILTVGSMGGDAAPRGYAEICSFGTGFVPECAMATVANSEPVGEISHYAFPSNRWRRYDLLRRLPEGFLVVGDGICSFNPIYGQGMTVASIEAEALRDCLLAGPRQLPRRFFRAAAKPIGVAWQTAVGSDSALPEVKGRRSLSMRLSNVYLDRVMDAAGSDLVVAQQFQRIIGMLDAPQRMFRPAFILRVVMALRSKQPEHREHALFRRGRAHAGTPPA
jgi:2-polyprenyl-6-methoxyphenol hydroxylase-like FAD-dependent oxidoreductase